MDDLTPKIKNSFIENKEVLMMSKELAKIRTDLKLEIPSTKLIETIFESDLKLKESQKEVSELELNKYIRKYKNQQESENISLKNPDIVDINKENLPDKSIIFEFEEKLYLVSDKIAGKLTDTDFSNKEFISLTTQNIFKIYPKFSDNSIVAYDCLVFIHDPNKRPDNLLNLCKHVEQANLLTKKSSIEEYLNFLSLNYKKIVSEIKLFESDKDLMKLYAELDYPIISVLNSMHVKGVKISQNKIEGLSKFITNEINNYREKILQITKQDFNLNSPKQLAKVLFEDLNLPIIKKTPKGAPSTDGSVLEELSKTYELPKYILKYREYEKIRSTYIEGLKSEITSKNRVHTTYNLFGTATGRLSSEKPNLQNIPNKTDVGQKIREFFVADNNHQFVISDYSQIELRVLAHLSSDENMINI